MEGSESEAVFDAYNLNPQRFINETLNTIDDLVDGSFDFAIQKSKEIVGISEESTSSRSDDLARGVFTMIRQVIQPVLDKRLEIWEKYCIRKCFTVPDGFVLPKDKDNHNDGLFQEEVTDGEEFDSRLDLLRNRLFMAEKKKMELYKEISSLEDHLELSHIHQTNIAKVMQLFEDNAADIIFQEIGVTASKLQYKIEEITTKRRGGTEGIDHPKKKLLLTANDDLGISARQEEIEEAASLLRNI